MPNRSVVPAAFPCNPKRHLHKPRRAFSLLELLVVLAVATILTALLLPALHKLRENVHRVVCSSNLRQIGMGLAMYADDWRDALPNTVLLPDDPNEPIQPQELMAVHHGHNSRWDGLGLLFSWDYCRANECFYCPSHAGEHPIERYAERWQRPGHRPLYTNYHYAGHIDWITRQRRYFNASDQLILVFDGLRTADDFNHRVGLNIAFGDMSVRWRSDDELIYSLLPKEVLDGFQQEEVYQSIWSEIERAGGIIQEPTF